MVNIWHLARWWWCRTFRIFFILFCRRTSDFLWARALNGNNNDSGSFNDPSKLDAVQNTWRPYQSSPARVGCLLLLFRKYREITFSTKPRVNLSLVWLHFVPVCVSTTARLSLDDSFYFFGADVQLIDRWWQNSVESFFFRLSTPLHLRLFNDPSSDFLALKVNQSESLCTDDHWSTSLWIETRFLWQKKQSVLDPPLCARHCPTEDSAIRFLHALAFQLIQFIFSSTKIDR